MDIVAPLEIVTNKSTKTENKIEKKMDEITETKSTDTRSAENTTQKILRMIDDIKRRKASIINIYQKLSPGDVYLMRIIDNNMYFIKNENGSIRNEQIEI